MKRKVLFFISQLSFGGAERVISNLAGKFADENNDVILTTIFQTEKEYTLNDNVKRLSLFRNKVSQSSLKSQIEIIKKLRLILKKEKPDVIVAFMGQALYFAIIAAAGLKTKVIVSVRNDPEKIFIGKKNIFLAKNLLSFADGCVFQTEDAMLWFPKKLQKKSCIIFNPVNDKFYNVLSDRVENTIITCGRFTDQKNHKMLIDCMPDIINVIPDAVLKIFGEGILKNELQDEIDKLNMGEHVFLMGNSSSIENELSKADIFVLSSVFEGMPNALMEAMAVGLACISTDCPCGGPRILLDNGKNGILVPVNDIKKMTEALISLLSDKEMRNYYAENSKNASFSFTEDKIFDKWSNYIDLIV